MKIEGIPKDFLWGAATSAFQVEGAYDKDGKGLSIADIRSFRNNERQLDTKVVVDHYNHWEEDVELMKELGLRSYRFSINWTRIFPNGDEEEPNQKGLDFYHNLIDKLNEYNIEPMVTLYHFDQPYGLIEKYGGWVSRKSIDDYVKYADCLFEEFGDKVKYWLTINEQAVLVVASDMLGIDMGLPFKERYQKAFQANHHMWVAQAIVQKNLREKHPNSYIGPAVSYITTLPASRKSYDMMVAKELEDFYSFAQMEVAVNGIIPKYFENELRKLGIHIEMHKEDKETLKNGTANYLGVNWYCTTIVKSKNQPNNHFIFNRMDRIPDPDLKYTDWGWNYDPVGLRYGMGQLRDRFPNLPIVITECGWSQIEELENGRVHDVDRIDYLRDHIEQIGLAIQDGANIISFNPWSFIDILSVGDGMEKRYGLIYVDRTDFEQRTLKRYKKDSFYFYQKLIENNTH